VSLYLDESLAISIALSEGEHHGSGHRERLFIQSRAVSYVHKAALRRYQIKAFG